MVTQSIINRVLCIKINSKLGTSMGTAFKIEHSGKQYLVTAKHMAAEWHNKMEISILYNKRWSNLAVDLVGVTNDNIDIAVFTSHLLASRQRFETVWETEPSSKDIVLGQQIFFLGFPLGMTGGNEDKNQNFPFPLIKGGILSSITSAPTTFWIDGHNNPGFSGGPVVFIPGKRANEKTPYKIAGIISGYRSLREPVYNTDGDKIGDVKGNSGIIRAVDIEYAIDLIKLNPIGHDIRKSNPDKSPVFGRWGPSGSL